VSDPKDDAETFEHADVARLARVSPPEPSGAAAATPVDLKPRAMLKRNGDSGVCRAVVDKQAVVIKFVISCDPRRIDALLNEGNLYGRQLKLLQGVAIPRLYAVCKGTADDKGFTLSVACLFFEDCGDPVTTPFIYLPMCDRIQIIRLLGFIHQCKVDLYDFAERNVVHRDGDYRLIDFQDVDEEHTMCGWTGGLLHEGEPEPDVELIGCEDLHDTAREMDIWKPSADSVKILGSNYSKSFSGLPNQEDIDELCGPPPTSHYNLKSLNKLLEWLQDYTEYKDKMTPAQYMAKYKRPSARD